MNKEHIVKENMVLHAGAGLTLPFNLIFSSVQIIVLTYADRLKYIAVNYCKA